MSLCWAYLWNYKVIFYFNGSAVFCTGNCHWSGTVLIGCPGTIWMGPGPLRGLQEARIVDGWIASELSSCQDEDRVPLQKPEKLFLFFWFFFTCVLLPPWPFDSMLWNLITQHLWMIFLLRSRLQNKVDFKNNSHCSCCLFLNELSILFVYWTDFNFPENLCHWIWLCKGSNEMCNNEMKYKNKY